jgi:ankyrin repeat protein
LHYAGEMPNNKQIVALLVQNGALDAHVRPPDDLTRQFFTSVFLGDEIRVKSLLSRHPRLATTVDGRGDYPILHAARNGDTEIVRLLIDYGADVNAANDRGHTVLYCAGGHGHLDTVKLLLDNAVDVNAKFTTDGMTLLEWLAQYPDDQRFVKISQVLTEYISGT